METPFFFQNIHKARSKDVREALRLIDLMFELKPKCQHLISYLDQMNAGLAQNTDKPLQQDNINSVLGIDATNHEIMQSRKAKGIPVTLGEVAVYYLRTNYMESTSLNKAYSPHTFSALEKKYMEAFNAFAESLLTLRSGQWPSPKDLHALHEGEKIYSLLIQTLETREADLIAEAMQASTDLCTPERRHEWATTQAAKKEEHTSRPGAAAWTRADDRKFRAEIAEHHPATQKQIETFRATRMETASRVTEELEDARSILKIVQSINKALGTRPDLSPGKH